MANTDSNVRLTSAEIAQLWSGYMGDSGSRCILTYFEHHCEDNEIKPILTYARELTDKHIDRLTNLFKEEGFPVPQGFTEEDVNVKAPRLFSDTFYLSYLRNVAKQGLALYSIALAVCARTDVRAYFSECLASVTELYNMTSERLLEKGLFIRAPYIPMPEAAEFVHKESFLNGIFGDRRPVTAMEISHLYANIQTNALGKALITGFAQTARNDDVKKFLLRGKEIAHKQVEVFSSILRDEDLPSPMTWDSDVLDSTDPPFSDKLMLFHVTGLNAAGALNYGSALAVAMRRDLASAYVRLTAEIMTYSDDGAELMIKHGWFEKIPGAVDRRELAAKH